jgi:hypothetical protein
LSNERLIVRTIFHVVLGVRTVCHVVLFMSGCGLWHVVSTIQAKSGEDPSDYTWAVFCMQAQLAVLFLTISLIFMAPEVHANLGASG